MTTRAVLPLLALCFAGCSAAPPAGEAGAARGSSPYPSKVFTPEQVSSPDVTATWTPGPDDLAPLEAGIGDCLRADARPEVQALAGRLSDYACQYAGVEVDGERAVHCNFLSPAEVGSLTMGSWDESWWTVMGGGTRFFRVNYLVASRTFGEVDVNAER